MTTKFSKKPHALGLFFREGIKRFKVHGSLLPSSRYLSRKILKQVEMREGIFIVELGAGTGAFTNMILSEMPKTGKLVIFEINPILVKHLRDSIIDSRVIIIEADAVDIAGHLRNLNLTKPDYIISGIPIGNFSKSMRNSLLMAIHGSLSDTGLFIQFQYFLSSLISVKKLFDAKIIGYECRNLPPAFIYGCRKKV
ncbi:MAG: rRNA adenine N-6-methyltransferase family protein [Patescibacteria group bacterium]